MGIADIFVALKRQQQQQPYYFTLNNRNSAFNARLCKVSNYAFDILISNVLRIKKALLFLLVTKYCLWVSRAA